MQTSLGMFLITSKNDKKIYLIDEQTCATVLTYEDESIKQEYTKLLVINSKLYSEYFIAIPENKSILVIYSTAGSNPHMKCSPIDEIITKIISIQSNLVCLGTTKGKIFIYDIFTGNNISTKQVSYESIVDMYYMNDFNSMVLTSTDTVQVFTLEQILIDNNNNTINFLSNSNGVNYDFDNSNSNNNNNDSNTKSYASIP